MAWNGSDQGKAKVEGQGQEKVERRGLNTQRSSLKHGVFAGAIVVALGCGAIWWFVGRPDADQLPTTNQPTTTHTIAEVKPDIATNAPSVGGDLRTPRDAQSTTPNPQHPTTIAQSRARLPWNRPGGVITNRIDVPKARFEVFNHPSETELCVLANTPAGDMIIGGFEYNEAFMKDLQQAMVERIEISPDDPDDIKQYKESVIAMKKQIAQMLKNGEDVPKALAETRSQLQELGIYKFEIEQAIDDMRNKEEEWSDDDVETFVKKANEILKEKGAEPFEFNKLTREIIKRNPFASPEEREQEDESIARANEAVLAEREAAQQSMQGENQ